ncbi:MAG: hypothetical protein V1779_12135 [bacterium]
MKDIKKILEKYYNGESTLDEENILKEFFLTHNIQPEIRRQFQDESRQEKIRNAESGIRNKEYEIDVFNFEKAMFEYFESEKKIELNEEFDKKIINKISGQNKRNILLIRNTALYRIVGIAAIFLIVFGLYIIFYNNDTEVPKKDTYTEDERFALEQTIETLTMVSEYLNLANEQMEKLSIINSSLETINKVSEYEQYNQYILNILGEES